MEAMRQLVGRLGGEMSVVVPAIIARLIVAAVLGGLIGLERELRHKPAGLRTNMFICFGAAMFTILSDSLAAEHTGDHTRIAAQIIPGIGFIGAGSILHSRGSVTGLTTAATLFVVASVGMAAGGGLYVTAVFATGLILIALHLLGELERRFSWKSLLVSYEVTGATTDVVMAELNRILDQERCTMSMVRTAGGAGHSRVMFAVDASGSEQEQLNFLLHQSSVFATVSQLGSVEHE